MKKLSVLLVGGYGVVGHQVALILNQYAPHLELIIAGRDINKAGELAKSLQNAQGIAFDIEKICLPDDLNVDIILSTVNDPQDNLFYFANKHGIAYVDIARWTERLQITLSKAVMMQNTSSMIFASSWMASVVSALANDMTKSFKNVTSIDISILASSQDKAGPDSFDYLDRLAIPFIVKQSDRYQKVLPFSDERIVSFGDNGKYKVFRMDMPEQFTLPLMTNAKTVATRIGYNNHKANDILAFVIKSGIWKLISGDLFKKLRKKIFYHPGSGDQHQIRIDVHGVDENGHQRHHILHIKDPKGQSHLTATGAAALIMQLAEHIQDHQPNIFMVGEAFLSVQKLKDLLQSEGIPLDEENEILK
ncbi:Saccharopine dehydrogenase involved in xenocoumacin synthesis [Xenorhabdus nematophila F1]|uniref:saccharopine dehydrogenase family protein n=1 Tax=Xenorhabdus nematophila TaxID=628 RepID=UPI000327590F|nr:Saccharopine dehydrogenase involved in xenocoumacin synthesis [Xenorhabdus nematophila]CCW30961.1 Saccharopine dehydrogenase involved in xenocoumacin synthesis [Xenorhabdus nematophila F1]CEE92508.1 Saccharopine dehydrogenase involved in xenocoumacin synthesis [Xenorhabdus nematophila str. Anatoliense]CEE95813.1 Saccharopine dehydrogenase involved in xenocoumacin synthesis [Xenorhabdus nematophila str. Anatoliense]